MLLNGLYLADYMGGSIIRLLKGEIRSLGKQRIFNVSVKRLLKQGEAA